MSSDHWLLLRGLAREQRHWGAFPGVLAATLGAEVHGIDLPGTGTEHLRSSPASIGAILSDTRERWLALRQSHPGRWRLLGVSLGGMVAMGWCARHPDDFAGVVLMNTSAANLSAPWRRMDLRVLPSVLRALVETDRVARERRILGVTTRLHNDLDRVAAQFSRFQEDQPIVRSNVLRQLFAATRFRAPASLAIPSLVLSGGADPFTHPDCPRRLAVHFGTPLAIHPGAGHDLALDDPTWVAETVRAWLAGSLRATLRRRRASVGDPFLSSTPSFRAQREAIPWETGEARGDPVGNGGNDPA